MTKCYAFMYKIQDHLLFKVSMATDKKQRRERTWLKVCDEVCWSGLIPYEAIQESFNPQVITTRSIFSPVKKKPIPREMKMPKLQNTDLAN